MMPAPLKRAVSRGMTLIAIRELRGLLEMLAKLTGDLVQRQHVEVTPPGKWVAVWGTPDGYLGPNDADRQDPERAGPG